MNLKDLFPSKNNIDTVKPSFASTSAAVRIDNSDKKQQKSWDPGEPCCSSSIDKQNPNISDGDPIEFDVDEILDQHSPNDIDDGFLTENDSECDKDSEPNFTQISSPENSTEILPKKSPDLPSTHIPNLDKLLSKNESVENDETDHSNDEVVGESKSEIIHSTKIFDDENEADDDNNELHHNCDLNQNEISRIFDAEGKIPEQLTTEIDEVENLFHDGFNEKKGDINEEEDNDNDDEQSIEKSEANMTVFLSVESKEDKSNEKNENETKKLTEIDKLMKKYNSFDSSGSNNDDDEDFQSNNLLKKQTNGKAKPFEKDVVNDDELDDDLMTDEEFPPPLSDDDIDEEILTIKRKKRTMISTDDEENVSTEGEPNGKFPKQSSDPLENDNDKTNQISLSKNDSQSSISTETKKKIRKRRKRIVINDDSSISNDSSDIDDNPDKDSTRKKIRKVLKDENLRDETKNAEKAELDRRKRIEEKQKLYNSINEKIIDPIGQKNEECKRLILDFDKQTKEVLVEVDKHFVEILKPHQIEGIMFMFNSTIESVERLKKHGHESGCILAHSMGLGKTLQVIAFLHTIMKNVYTRDIIKHVLIIVPLNVARNWRMEFDKWLEFDNCIATYETTSTKNLYERIKILQRWRKNGGVLIMTINLFSQMITGKRFSRREKANDVPVIRECLLNPGPDIVIVDEGHLLKNDKTIFNCTISQIRTLRRIILTGTPLQNNLSEYFIMVDFVKPNLLGTKREFKNRFENPISNGQHVDSTDADVHYMKRRVHVLHQKLKDAINRHDYSVLVPYLKPKYEFVLTIKLTTIQIELYKNYLDNFASATSGKNLLNDFTVLRYIWNHPATLVDQCRQKMEKEGDSLKNFIVSDDEDDDLVANIKIESNGVEDNNDKNYDNESDIECVFDNLEELHKEKRLLRSKGQAPDIPTNHENLNGLIDDGASAQRSMWWKNILKDYGNDDIYRIELSSKFILLFSIMEECEKVGDKLLVFSQSLHNLDLIEKILYEKNLETNEKFGENIGYNELVEKTGGVSNRWIRDIDYFRIDGKVSCDSRTNIINNFNDIDDHRSRLMLISTKAGSLGINLIGANRCIIFDVSWNPTHDLQAIYRIFRYGQEKPVYIYRFISYGTMEQKIYDRQIMKQSMALRVIDEHQIARYFKQSELCELYTFIPEPPESAYRVPPVEVGKSDLLICDLYRKHKDLIVSFHQHDSLLENRPEENLTEEERRAAWDEFESEIVPKNIIPTNALNPLMMNGLSQQNVQMTSLLQHRFNQSMLTGAIIPTNDFYSRLNEETFRYYNNQYAQSQLPLQRQEYIAPSSNNHQFLLKPITDQTLKQYFDQVTNWMKQNPITDHLRYRNATMETLRIEFQKEFFSQISTREEFSIKFLLYVNNIYLFLRHKRRSLEIDHEVIKNLARIKESVIKNRKLEQIESRLNHIIFQTGQSIRATTNQPPPQQQSLVRKPVQNSDIECINLDSD
uniref:Transcriptional regulator ATRX homolog n=1 Tax=Dermatophagoides pteronyssinus TaxID=6956 RepID=A0A6P6XXR4_DERPT|nr:transcriptional regulator ATRX homolog [Dermatophagoides pteronyssinus]